VAKSPATPVLPFDFSAFLEDLKGRIRSAQVKAALTANRQLIALYWDIGRAIALKQESEGWGTKVIDRLAMDLQREFPGTTDFSRGNVYRMRAFYLAYAPGRPIVAQAVRQSDAAIVSQPARQLSTKTPPEPMASLPWFHNVVLLESLKSPTTRTWYAEQAIAHGWSRNMLEHWIDSDLYARQGKAVTNFHRTLLPPQSDLAQQALKDPYVFDFLTIAPDALERALETDLIAHVTRFLLELGADFAFVGRQYHLGIEGEDYYLDLLFYHVRLHCFVVLDLKAGAFKPEYAGKMNFYLSAADDLLRATGDQPSIGLILCRKHGAVTAEYALRDIAKPIGVARWKTRITGSLPKHLQGARPTVAQLEAELRTPKGKRMGDY
jgi:predicted nuclease of restriction endonuclease-like (RecB) superfamily